MLSKEEKKTKKSSKKIYIIMGVTLFFLLISITSAYVITGKFVEIEKPNIILITIDTLRYDHLSCYGFERKTSPAADALAEDGVLFETAIVPLPKTTPSLFSILSGLYPKTHKVCTLGMMLSDKITLIPEVLKEKGYHTGGIVGQYNCNRKFGFMQGFDFYDDEFVYMTDKTHKNVGGRFHPESERRAEYVTEKSIEWIESVMESPDPFFIWMHYMDPHAAYDPPDKYSDYFSGSTKMSANSYYGAKIPERKIHSQAKVHGISDYDFYLNKYDGEIAYLDSYLEKFFNFLKEEELYEDSLIIFTADHGEYMGEHKGRVSYFSHGLTLFDSEIRVPLIIKLPKNEYANKRIDNHASVIDIFPTVLSVIGESNSYSDGKSLIGLIKGEPRYIENVNYIQLKYGKILAVRKDHYKVIVKTEYKLAELRDLLRENKKTSCKIRLFDLESDPLERKNIYNEYKEFAKNLAGELFEWVASYNPESEKAYTTKFKLDEDAKRRLESLGYINPGADL